LWSEKSNLEDFDGKTKEKKSKYARRRLKKRRYNRIVVQYLEHRANYHSITQDFQV
jgi:hypothetical protein